ncbi:chorismate mutase [Candidatus Tremblaya phenacola]|uniref:Bifunctional chorismate mutase/prephenate dehydratase n=1 Tax=Candidatus Tremblayella phenacoccinincola TaxID=1010676 RepID=A0A2G0V748_9PROT|nr:chorismate mutase [Candidatus Tremblaya phenacola]PHN16304.1 P-protein [Candidatus Tremblaya phenacola]
MHPCNTNSHLRYFRYRIDLVDKVLVKLLETRIKVATKVGRVKITLSSPITNSSRERQVISNLISSCMAVNILKVKDLREVWKRIISISKRSEGHSVTSFYGSPGSHTHSVMDSCFDMTTVSFPFSLIDETPFIIYSSLNTRLPFRNNCSGLLHTALATMNNHNVHIQNYISHCISQHLVLSPSNRYILSVTQTHAYNQTKQWNSRNSHTMYTIMNTSKAAKVSCICNSMLSISGRSIITKYSIESLDPIQDRWNNKTSFLELQRKGSRLYICKKVRYILLTHRTKICRDMLLLLLAVIKQNIDLLESGVVYYKRLLLLLCKRNDKLSSKALRMISISKKVGFYTNNNYI